MDCIFCRIVRGEIPAYQVYEDQDVLSFLDINPAAPGHTLVIPKKHFSNLDDISEEDLKSLILGVQKTAKKLNFNDYQLIQNNGRGAGQEVFHLHFHIVPRSLGDGQPSFNHYKYQAGEMESFINKLKK